MKRAILYLVIPAALLTCMTLAYVYMPIEPTGKGEIAMRALVLVGLGLLLAIWAFWFVAKMLAGRTPDAADSAEFGDWLSEQVYNDTQDSLTVVVEPWGDRYVLRPNESIFVKTPDASDASISMQRSGAQVRVKCENADAFKVTMEGRDITHAHAAS